MKNRGFTLIELLAVIVILVLLLLFTVPAITKLLDKASAKAFISEYKSIKKVCEAAYADMSIDNNNFLDCKGVYILLPELYEKGYTKKEFLRPNSNGDIFNGTCYIEKDGNNFQVQLIYTDGQYWYVPLNDGENPPSIFPNTKDTTNYSGKDCYMNYRGNAICNAVYKGTFVYSTTEADAGYNGIITDMQNDTKYGRCIY